MEIRKFNSCEVVDDGNDNIVMVKWDLYRDEQYSHTYEQYYTKSSKEQFITDVTPEVAEAFLDKFL